MVRIRILKHNPDGDKVKTADILYVRQVCRKGKDDHKEALKCTGLYIANGGL